MKQVTCKADVSISRLKGLDESTVRDFMSRLKASPKCRERRSLLSECRLWFAKHRLMEKTVIRGHEISQQDGCYV